MLKDTHKLWNKKTNLQPLDCGEKMKQMQAVTQSAVKIWITPSFMEKESCRKEQNTALQAKISGYYLFTFTNSVLDSNHFYHNMKYDISVFGVVT